MQGAVDRSEIYKSIEISLDALIEQSVGRVYKAGRDIRRAEVGEAIAAEEEKRGSKTDDEYAQESAKRRTAREKARQQEEVRKRREEEKEKLRAEEKKKRLELEKLRSADEKRREDEAKEKQKEEEREAQRAVLKQQQQEKELERQERYERRKQEQSEREGERHRSRELVRSSYDDMERTRRSAITSHIQTRNSPSRPTPPPPVDEKALEEAALELLLREGRELAAKSGSKPDFERSQSLDPPLRKTSHLSKAKLSDLPPPRIASPHKSSFGKIDHQSVPKLGFNNTNLIRELSNPLTYSQSRSRSRSPQTHHSRHYSRSRSRSRMKYSSRRHDEQRHFDLDVKALWKKQAAAQREREAEDYKRAAVRSRSGTQERDLPPPPHQTHYRERHHHTLEQHHSHRSKRLHSTNNHISRSRSRERRHERSRSPETRNVRNGGYEVGRGTRAHRSRDKSPIDIDRYVPGGGVIRGRERDREREREREMERERERERGREKGREKERERKRGRDGERKEGGREEKHRGFVEIDRYVPDGGDDTKRRGRERSG